MSESEPLLSPSGGPASAISTDASASGDITEVPVPLHLQQARRAAAAAGGGGDNDGGEGDEEQVGIRRNPTRRRWKGPLLFPCGTSYESLGVCCAVGACFPCPLLWPCVFSHSHGRLLGPRRVRAARLATFALFSLFVFVPWVLLRVPLSVARAQVCAPVSDTGGRGIPRSTVVECLRLIKIDDVVFWVSVGLTAAALVAAGVLRFAVRRRLGIEGGCGCCGGGRGGRKGKGGRGSAAAAAAKGATKGEGSSPSPCPSLLAAGSWLLADVLSWLLCPACALCQEARTAAAWEREKGTAAGANDGSGGGGDEEEALLLEAPAVPPTFDRGGDGV